MVQAVYLEVYGALSLNRCNLQEFDQIQDQVHIKIHRAIKSLWILLPINAQVNLDYVRAPLLLRSYFVGLLRWLVQLESTLDDLLITGLLVCSTRMVGFIFLLAQVV